MAREKYCIQTIHGGLGDQLYKYFAGVYFAEKQKRRLIIDFSFIENSHHGRSDALLNLLQIDINNIEGIPKSAKSRKKVYSKLMGRLSSRRVPFRAALISLLKFSLGILYDTLENYELQDSSLVLKKFRSLRFHKYIFLVGYFSDFNYFDNLSSESQILPGLFLNNNSNSPYAVAHFRNGDIFDTYKTIGVLDDFYYKKAIQEVHNRLFEGKIFGISDNVTRAKEIHNLPLVDFIPESDTWDAFEVFRFLSFAHVRICANSGLSLWASKLSPIENSVTICPIRLNKAFDYDVVRSLPKNWRRIENGFLDLH